VRVVPTNQRLHGQHLPGPEVELRLVVEEHVAVVDGATQGDLEVEAIVDRRSSSNITI
jgi:hypothetical protein